MKTITEKEYYNFPKKERYNFTGIIKWNSGVITYWKNGILHRIDGPAWVWDGGIEQYFIYGKKYTKEDYGKHPDVIRNSKESKDVLKYKNI